MLAGVRPPLLALLLLCHCGARTLLEEAPPSASVSSGQPTSPAEQFLRDFPDALCQLYEPCCKEARSTQEACRVTQRERMTARAREPGMIFDPARAEQCLQLLRSTTSSFNVCWFQFDEDFAPCAHAFSPDPQNYHPGERCEPGDPCVDGDLEGECRPGLHGGESYCQIDLTPVPGQPLSPCRSETSGLSPRLFRCEQYGMVCLYLQNQCSPGRDLGQPCEASGDCLENLVCDGGLCVYPLSTNAPCTAPTSLCVVTTYCLDGKCSSLPSTEDACLDGQCHHGACLDGLCRDVGPEIASMCGRQP